MVNDAILQLNFKINKQNKKKNFLHAAVRLRAHESSATHDGSCGSDRMSR